MLELGGAAVADAVVAVVVTHHIKVQGIRIMK
jgi:hypothetical protein